MAVRFLADPLPRKTKLFSLLCSALLCSALLCSQNRSRSARTVKALLSSSSVYYTGITANPVKKAQGEFVLAPGQSESKTTLHFPIITTTNDNVCCAEDTLSLTIRPDDYLGRLVDYCMMKIYALIKVKETHQTWSDEDDFVMEKPKLKVEVGGLSNFCPFSAVRYFLRLLSRVSRLYSDFLGHLPSSSCDFVSRLSPSLLLLYHIVHI